VFGFAALQAVILNKAMSLIVVVTALPARLLGVSWSEVATHWPVAVNLLAGSLVGAWLGASWATRMRSANLYRVLAALLLLIACALAVTTSRPAGDPQPRRHRPHGGGALSHGSLSASSPPSWASRAVS
jgi:uncharacterized protein